MLRFAPAALLVLLGACTTDLAPVPQHDYLVQYQTAINGADSAVIGYLGGTISLVIPLAKAMVFQSPPSLAEVQSIPDGSVTSVDSVNQVVNVIVFFMTPPSAMQLISVKAPAASTHFSGPFQFDSMAIETGFRLSDLNHVARVSGVRDLGLDYPGPMQGTLVTGP